MRRTGLFLLAVCVLAVSVVGCKEQPPEPALVVTDDEVDTGLPITRTPGASLPASTPTRPGALSDERATARPVENTPEPPADDSEPTPTATTVVPSRYGTLDLNLTYPYLQDGGALPPNAVARLGIGFPWRAWSSDGGESFLLATASGLYAYQLDDFERIWRRYLEDDFWRVSVSSDGTRAVTSYGFRRGAILHDALTGNRVASLPGWYEAELSPDSTKVAIEARPNFSPSGDAPGIAQIQLFNAQTGDFMRSLEVEMPGFYGAVFSRMRWSQDSRLVAACGDQGLYIWNALTAELLYDFSIDSTTGGLYLRYCDFAISPDSTRLLAVDSDNRYIFDLIEGEVILEEPGSFDDAAWIGNRVFVAAGHNLDIRDAQTGTVVDSLNLQALDMAVSPDGTRLVVATPQEMVVVDGESLAVLASLPRHFDYVWWSPGGRWIIGYDYQSDQFSIVDSANGELLLDPFETEGGLNMLSDDAFLIEDRNQLLVLDLNQGEIVDGRLLAFEPTQLNWSDDGSSFLFSSRDQVYSWDSTSGTLATLPPDTTIGDNPTAVMPGDWRDYELEFLSPDGRYRVKTLNDTACGDGPFGGGCGMWGADVELFDLQTQQPIATLELSRSGVMSAAWSADGSRVALGRGGNTPGFVTSEIIILDLLTGEEITRLGGHLGDVFGMLFSPDGTRLASASSDGTIIIWQVP